MTENSMVTIWAEQNIPNPVEVKVRFNSLPVKIFLIAVFVFFAILFSALPAILAGVAIKDAVTVGWSSEITGRLGCSGVLFVVFAALLMSPVLYFKKMRGEMVKTFTDEGVETRNRRKHAWGNLQYINQVYIKRRYQEVPNSFELIFATGKAIVPPLIENQAAIVALVNAIPAERRKEIR